MFFMQKMMQKHCVLQWFLAKSSQNWGFELFFDQFCEIQAYPNLEGIPKKTKNNKPKNKKPKKQKQTKKQCLTQNAANIQKPIVTPFCLKLCLFLFFWFFGLLFFCFFLVFPLNWDRLGSHKIDQKIAQNLNFGEDFARNHCKTQCFCFI